MVVFILHSVTLRETQLGISAKNIHSQPKRLLLFFVTDYSETTNNMTGVKKSYEFPSHFDQTKHHYEPN